MADMVADKVVYDVFLFDEENRNLRYEQTTSIPSGEEVIYLVELGVIEPEQIAFLETHVKKNELFVVHEETNALIASFSRH